MGLLTGIIIYKAGKRRANKKRDRAERRDACDREEELNESEAEYDSWGNDGE